MRKKKVFSIVLCAGLVSTAGTANSQEDAKGTSVNGWDLTINNPINVNDTTLDNDQHFVVTATVSNIGNQASPGDLPIRVIQSADATIDNDDPRLDFDTIENPIAPQGNLTQAATVTETSPGPGTYWIFVCTDTAAGETNANNNCSAGVQVTVSGGGTTPPEPPIEDDNNLPGWDLTINNPISVSDTTLDNDQHFVVTATVSNIGTQSSPGNLPIRVIQSADATVDNDDPRIDFDTIENPIAPQGNLTQAATVTETSPGPGTYWIFVCTDTAAGEVNAANNCSAGVQVTVSGGSTPPTEPPVDGGTQPGWDLTINDPISVSDTTLDNDQHFVVTATVSNIGTQPSPGNLPIRVIQSADATVDNDDPRIDFDTIENPIAPQGNLTQAATVTETSPGPGTYWIFVCTDTAAGEANANNNCSAGVQVTVSGGGTTPPEPPIEDNNNLPGWDLTINNPISVSDTTLGNDQHFVVTATVSNIGTQLSPGNLPIRVIQSADATVDNDDPRIDFDTIENPIAPQGNLTQAATVTETSPGPGTYWIFVCTDTAAGEVSAANNCSAGQEVNVTGSTITRNVIFGNQLEN